MNLTILQLIYSLEWLVDVDPRGPYHHRVKKLSVNLVLYLGKEDELIETMQLARNSGFSWKNDWYTAATFPQVAVTEFTMQTYAFHFLAILGSSLLWLSRHGVNNAEGISFKWNQYSSDDSSNAITSSLEV